MGRGAWVMTLVVVVKVVDTEVDTDVDTAVEILFCVTQSVNEQVLVK